MPINGDKYDFSQKNVDGSPEQPGVYALFAGGELIYYGKADNSIRTRLQSHKAGREGRGTQIADTYMREPCTNPSVRERQLLIEFRNAYGRLPRCNEVMP